jgi:hypothetical protein
MPKGSAMVGDGNAQMKGSRVVEFVLLQSSSRKRTSPAREVLQGVHCEL